MGNPQSKEEVIIAQNGGGNTDNIVKGVSITELALIILIVILALMIISYGTYRLKRVLRKEISAEINRRSRIDSGPLRV